MKYRGCDESWGDTLMLKDDTEVLLCLFGLPVGEAVIFNDDSLFLLGVLLVNMKWETDVDFSNQENEDRVILNLKLHKLSQTGPLGIWEQFHRVISKVLFLLSVGAVSYKLDCKCQWILQKPVKAHTL